jgi:cytochrome c biogenesis protein CcdA
MGDFLSKENITADNLKDKIVGYSSTGNGLPLQEGSKVDHENLDFNKLPGLPQLWGSSQNPPSNLPTVFVIIGAAVLDSINPCEFAVLVILLSGVIAGEGREKALKTGIAFVSGVFMMYFLMGLGIFAIVKNFNITYYFYKAVGVFALIVGAINIRDYFSKDSGGVLSSVPQSWRPRVQKLLDSVTSVPGALFSGFFVSIFLLPCTSAPYEVILGWIAKETAIDISAVMLLLLYNLIFILPMVAIVLAVYFGLTTPAKAAHWKHRRVRLLHLIAGVVMVGMGIWMVFFFG